MRINVNLSRKNKPLYMQIKSIIKDRILHGVYPIESNIPSEPQLESEFGVSKITVRNAIGELVQEGYLEKGSGKGTKVVRNTSTSKLSKQKRFTEVLVESGHRIRKELLIAEVVVNEAGSLPHRLFGSQCYRIERLYHLNDEPYIHYMHYLTMKAGGIELSDLTSQSLYDMLEEHEVALEKFRDEFAVTLAPAHIEQRLRVAPGTPLLKRSRYSYDGAGNLIEFSEGLYNTAMHNYVVNYDI
ncbi:GntR family transcriptional regulator [Paenibacillus sp. LHD-117]|uniref:GntR family transcriptional regulator n=1 Tax=Paenibacillus sp. LHD-117 TaxID=3071412 RepID=UPI0027DF3252|nr:GntR family transcriptional regulator [Paenibacillus sp. LHD-117]MDQ6418917.1 GntR family transcriptional regulator [Paenibacillus sp. LHD-117]